MPWLTSFPASFECPPDPVPACGRVQTSGCLGHFEFEHAKLRAAVSAPDASIQTGAQCQGRKDWCRDAAQEAEGEAAAVSVAARADHQLETVLAAPRLARLPELLPVRPPDEPTLTSVAAASCLRAAGACA